MNRLVAENIKELIEQGRYGVNVEIHYDGIWDDKKHYHLEIR